MIAFASTTTAHAQTQATTPQRVDRVEVTGRNAEEQSPDLDKKSDGASRLGLTIRETPASIDVIGQDVMTRRGARTFDEALSGAVGVTAGGNPGSPSVVSTRGFTGAFVNFLYDGDRVSQSSMSSRSQDSFNYDRIEVLKGAASMIFGDGGVGGSVNFVTKRPDRNRTGSEALISYGSYESLRAGVGTGGAFGSGAYRIDVSHNRRDGGWIDRNGQQLTHLTSGLNFTLTPTLSLDISLDYLKDDIESYWGTPLVPLAFATEATGAVTDASGRVLDRRIARNNYNVEDGVMKADSAWLRAKLSWKASDAWTLQNQFSY
ncbi:MAG: TonB-dependent siderophore receptor, partial [Burkholderiales bacterium]